MDPSIAVVSLTAVLEPEICAAILELRPGIKTSQITSDVKVDSLVFTARYEADEVKCLTGRQEQILKECRSSVQVHLLPWALYGKSHDPTVN